MPVASDARPRSVGGRVRIQYQENKGCPASGHGVVEQCHGTCCSEGGQKYSVSFLNDTERIPVNLPFLAAVAGGFVFRIDKGPCLSLSGALTST